MNHTVNLQSYRTIHRAAFARALLTLRRQKIRAILSSTETNDFGHVRTYTVSGRWEAARLADAAFDNKLLTWKS